MKTYDVAIVGATGAVGEVMRSILDERNFPVANLHLVASARSAGKKLQWKNSDIVVEDLATFDFSKVDIALFSAGGSISAEFAPRAAEHAVVIDNTSHFRYQDAVPLVIPEVNPDHIEQFTNTNIIANPNCSTIQMLVALNPIQQSVGIERINVCTYQAVSGSGASALNELHQQNAKLVAGDGLTGDDVTVYPYPIAGNALPQIDVVMDNDYTKEEMKMLWETRKMFADDTILVNPTCVRIPVDYGHSTALHIETRSNIAIDKVLDLLRQAPGVTLKNDIRNSIYPTPLCDARDSDAVFVGRVRKDISHPNGINLWAVSNNLRKGAALNSVQIAELLIARSLI